MFTDRLSDEMRPGATGAEVVRMHAIARLMLHGWIHNIQCSWVKEGPKLAQLLLTAGCNDVGGTLINESISTAAGSAYGQLVPPSELRRWIRDIGRIPTERTTLYGTRRVYEEEPSGAGAAGRCGGAPRAIRVVQAVDQAGSVQVRGPARAVVGRPDAAGGACGQGGVGRLVSGILAIAGGVGGAKLALGLSRVLAPDDLTIVVNTGDDETFHGLHVSPDIDTVTYALAGLTNADTGWGVAGDSFRALETLGRLGGDTWFGLGDLDLGSAPATHRAAGGGPYVERGDAGDNRRARHPPCHRSDVG